jgi:endonuclease YncB( thermonuclease family)
MGHRSAIPAVVAGVIVSLAVAAPGQADTTVVTVVRWSDGDTVVTTGETVRLIGIDAPDRKECGFRAARNRAARLAPEGAAVTLVDPGSVRGTDDYGRLLRYVRVDGRDVGLRQIRAGSQARYDSTDGRDHHPKQKRYRAQDIRHRDYCARADLASYPPVSDSACPKGAPIKGNRGDDWIYHLPTDRYYEATNPEECFATGDGAKKHGYRAALI